MALDTQSGAPTGYLGVSVGSETGSPQFLDVDENDTLFGGVTPGGALILDASHLQTSAPSTMALFLGPSTEANPNVGPVGGGTQVQFIPTPADSGGSADGIATSMEAYFGATPATEDLVGPYSSSSNGGNFLTATAPPASSPGPVSVVLTDANENPVFLPDAYTYGPHLLRVQPNMVGPQGGDLVTIFAYGLGFSDLSDIQITVGGSSVNVTTASLNSYASFVYPEQSVTIPVPSGTPGWADIKLTTSNGSDTIKRGIQYLNQEINLPGGGPFTFAVYDSVRDLFYLTGNGSSVAVFNPVSGAFAQPLQSAEISPTAVLQSEALTPDSSELLVADPFDQSVVVFDLAGGTSTAVKVLLPSDPLITLSGPMPLVAAAGNSAFVTITPCITDPVREIDLPSLSVQTRPDATTTCGIVPPLPFGGSSGDGTLIVFAGNSGEEPPGAEYIWSYTSASNTFSGPVSIADTPWVNGKAAVNSDGTVIALSQGTLDQALLPLVPLTQGGLDSRLNETGSLLYSVDNAVLISDTRNGRELFMINLPGSVGPILGPDRPLAIDPAGDKVLVATMAGVSYFDLSVVPLAVGTISPGQASTGTSVTIRGSGFTSGTTVQMNGQTARCTLGSSEVLSCVVPTLSPGLVAMTLINPDGQTFSFENAFTVP
jgi:hypothetical protein